MCSAECDDESPIAQSKKRHARRIPHRGFRGFAASLRGIWIAFHTCRPTSMTTRVLFAVRPHFTRAEIGFWRRLHDALQERGLTLVLSSPERCPGELNIEHITVAASPNNFFPVTDGGLAGVPVSLLGLEEEALLARESASSGPALVPAIERCRREALTLIAADYLQWLHTLAPVLTIVQEQHVAEWTLASASRVGGIPVLYTEGEPTVEGLFDADVLAQRILNAVGHTPWRLPDALMREIIRLRSARATSWPPEGTAWLDRRDVLSLRLDEWRNGHLLRNALLPAYEAARQHRRVRVWGSGAARQAVSALLEAAGASVEAQVVGIDHIATTQSSDFIIVATSAHDGTAYHLESLGFRCGLDYSIIEPQVLHALHLRVAAA
jgi:hypothetical protein